MRTLRASEIGDFLYCQRAWWYRKRGAPSANQAELAGGAALHSLHGRGVWASSCLQIAAYALLLLALALFTIWVMNLVL